MIDEPVQQERTGLSAHWGAREVDHLFKRFGRATRFVLFSKWFLAIFALEQLDLGLRMAAEVVHQLVVCDGEEPGAELRLDLVAIARRAEANTFAQFTHFVDPAIGGGVDFNDVNGTTDGDLHATRTYATRRGGGPLNAVQKARHQSGNSRFASSTLAAEDIAMRNPALLNGVLERGLYVCLADQL